MEVDAYIAGPIAAGADPADEQFRLLVQSVTDYAIFLLDSSGRIISWNDGAERIKGYSAGEIVGRSIALFYPPEDRDAGKPEQGLRCAEREGRFRTEGWRVRKDGSRFWADVAITALRDARGGLRGFAKVTRDMTARHRERENEQRVAALLERQRGLAELSLLALGETGLQPVLERTVALTRDLLQTEFVQAVANVVSAAVQRQRAHEQVQASEARLLAFADHSPAVMFLKDREGRYRLVNEQFLQRFGLRRDQVIGRTDLELFPRDQALSFAANDAEVLARGVPLQFEESARYIEGERFTPSFEGYLERVHPDDREQARSTVARALTEGRGFIFDERIVRPGGELRYLRSRGEVLRDDQGRSLKVLGTCLDITEQKNA